MTNYAITILAGAAIALEALVIGGFFGSLGYIALAAVGVI